MQPFRFARKPVVGDAFRVANHHVEPSVLIEIDRPAGRADARL